MPMPLHRWHLLAILALFALPPSPARAQPACPDILLGDSLAVGMAPHARALGFTVIAQQGAGIAWLRQQEPRCARRLVLVFGTNDLRGMAQAEAEAYPLRIAAVMEQWDAQQAIWATPGCFQDAALERGSAALDAALSRHLRRASDRLRDLPAIHSGRLARCAYASHDGIHPTGVGYQAWWAGLAQWLDRTRMAGMEPVRALP
ncbi:SGNH/GDSL hydrolase family protein [Sediminicoccus sp. KRV36]|uniref:SGNH/GDSL hydrolase family protein n=1 Tax=Sediminicoccus sp. KRV36 TaxID=3133721 RepID=UPI00200CF4B8|nr:SGNH/GDSL hydrolase family protein [Sediminicoccus rosea]UPY36312.1 SGNH/GDSL hydrolase family protein [Sediminicoccus rosea]